MEQKALAPMLYLCATPIGNLGDITYRAVEVLSAVGAVYCEDTRRTGELLNHLGIKKPLLSCHAHNEAARGEEIAARVLAGEAIAFVSDAGMPGISDPGERLVAACLQKGAAFTVIPGASAPLTALVLSGLPVKNACFAGFLPREPKPRREAIASIGGHKGPLIFYESPLRVAATAKELAHQLGDRPCALCRELTKRFEETVRCTLLELAARYEGEPPKGECVLVVAGAEEKPPATPEEAEAAARQLLNSGLSVKDAARHLSALLDLPRNEAYALVSRMKGE